MAAVDLTLELREAVVVKLRASTSLTSLVEATEIYGEKPKAKHKPTFIRLGFPEFTPFSPTGVNGSRIEFRVNTFTQGESTDGITKINKAVIAALDDSELNMDDSWSYDVSFVRAQVVNDTAEASAFHGLLDFVALVGVDA